MNPSSHQEVPDYITGKPVKYMGAEKTRQIFERFLVEKKGWAKNDIRVGEKITVQFNGEDYASSVDLVVFCEGKAFMAIACVSGSIGSYEREIISAARLVYDYQIPFAVSTDAREALILDTATGKSYQQNLDLSLDAVFSKKEALEFCKSHKFPPLDEARIKREMIIFRSFNLERHP